jgi:hypothetical protein
MLKDIPVVPPDSVIHTFSHLTTAKASLILTQDGEQLSHGSFLLRNAGGSKESNDWAKFFLDTCTGATISRKQRVMRSSTSCSGIRRFWQSWCWCDKG